MGEGQGEGLKENKINVILYKLAPPLTPALSQKERE